MVHVNSPCNWGDHLCKLIGFLQRQNKSRILMTGHFADETRARLLPSHRNWKLRPISQDFCFAKRCSKKTSVGHKAIRCQSHLRKDLYTFQREEKILRYCKFSEAYAQRERRGEKSLPSFFTEKIRPLGFDLYLSLQCKWQQSVCGA